MGVASAIASVKIERKVKEAIVSSTKVFLIAFA
jgi:hypothetical protein